MKKIPFKSNNTGNYADRYVLQETFRITITKFQIH